MLTYPRFAKACYAFFAVAVLAAILKLSVSDAEPSLLKLLPAAPTASAVEPAAKPPEGSEDPRLGGFSDDGEAERLEAVFSRSASRGDDVPEASEPPPSSSAYDASVFRRPSLERGSSEPVCGDLGDAPGSSRVVFPLPEAYFNSYDDTWGAARPQGGHEGSDLMSPAGTPEFAITDGRLVAVAGSNENGWNRLGGYTVMLEAAYDVGPIKKGDLFYYAHLDRESALPLGTEVRAGQRIGTVGDTGEGPEITRGKFPSHLHLGWYDAELSEKRSEAESGAMNPYPLLLWLEENGGAVSGGTDASYCQAPQGPNPTPSSGGSDWPIPAASGVRPDLDTGSDGGASPSIVIRKEHRHTHQQQRDRDRDNRPNHNGGNGEVGGGQRPEDNGSESNEAEGDEVEGDEANEIAEPGNARDETKKLSLRKTLEARKAALSRNRPGATFDRIAPKDRGQEKRDGKQGKDGRGGEESANEREEGRQEAERPARNRPGGNASAPPEETKEIPETPVPIMTSPREQEPRPASEGKGEVPKAAEKPEPNKPSEAKQEMPAAEPTSPQPGAVPEEPAGGAATREDDAPVRGEASSAVGVGTVPAAEPEAGEE